MLNLKDAKLIFTSMWGTLIYQRQVLLQRALGGVYDHLRHRGEEGFTCLVPVSPQSRREGVGGHHDLGGGNGTGVDLFGP
jgi:hypothetical protein